MYRIIQFFLSVFVMKVNTIDFTTVKWKQMDRMIDFFSKMEIIRVEVQNRYEKKRNTHKFHITITVHIKFKEQLYRCTWLIRKFIICSSTTAHPFSFLTLSVYAYKEGKKGRKKTIAILENPDLINHE